ERGAGRPGARGRDPGCGRHIGEEEAAVVAEQVSAREGRDVPIDVAVAVVVGAGDPHAGWGHAEPGARGPAAAVAGAVVGASSRAKTCASTPRGTESRKVPGRSSTALAMGAGRMASSSAGLWNAERKPYTFHQGQW